MPLLSLRKFPCHVYPSLLFSSYPSSDFPHAKPWRRVKARKTHARGVEQDEPIVLRVVDLYRAIVVRGARQIGQDRHCVDRSRGKLALLLMDYFSLPLGPCEKKTVVLLYRSGEALHGGRHVVGTVNEHTAQQQRREGSGAGKCSSSPTSKLPATPSPDPRCSLAESRRGPRPVEKPTNRRQAQGVRGCVH